jgi:hypothetical protein
MESKKRRSFLKNFKEEACILVIKEGQTISETAHDLGIGQGMLGLWGSGECQILGLDEGRSLDCDGMPSTIMSNDLFAVLRKETESRIYKIFLGTLRSR